MPPPCIKLLKCSPAGRTMSNRIENNFEEQIECISLKGADVYRDRWHLILNYPRQNVLSKSKVIHCHFCDLLSPSPLKKRKKTVSIGEKTYLLLGWHPQNTQTGSGVPWKPFLFHYKKLGHPLIIVNHAINLSVPQMNTALGMKQSLLACDVSLT